MGAVSFGFEEVPQHRRARWFVRRGAVTAFNRGFSNARLASEWIDSFGDRLEWRSGWLFKLKGDDQPMEIVSRLGETPGMLGLRTARRGADG